jgi:hypothetical protein
VILSRTRKFAYTAVLFAAGIGSVAWASATHQADPLFVAWVPLLAVPYVLTRLEPGMKPPPAEAPTDRTDDEPGGSAPGDA